MNKFTKNDWSVNLPFHTPNPANNIIKSSTDRICIFLTGNNDSIDLGRGKGVIPYLGHPGSIW